MKKIQVNVIHKLLFLFIVASMTACNILDDIKSDIESDVKDVLEENSSNNSEPLSPVDDSRVVNDQPALDIFPPEASSLVPLTLTYIKINDENINIELDKLNKSRNVGKNMRITRTEARQIRSAEFGFEVDNAPKPTKNYIGINLRSLSGGQNLNISYEIYRLDDFLAEAEYEETVYISYQDRNVGFYSEAFAVKPAQVADFFSVSRDKLSVNFESMLTFLAEEGFNERSGFIETEAGPISYDMAAQFFSGELYSLGINVGNEIVFNDEVYFAVNNCVFASSELAPADISDICRAYMAL